MEDSYTTVRFVGNNSKKWDGKETEVPAKTVMALGRKTAEGLEEAEVHWPGKGKATAKVWRRRGCSRRPRQGAGAGDDTTHTFPVHTCCRSQVT